MSLWEFIALSIPPILLVGVGGVVIILMLFLFAQTRNHSWLMLSMAVLMWIIFDIVRIIDPENMEVAVAMSRIGRLWLKLVLIYVCVRAIRELP